MIGKTESDYRCGITKLTKDINDASDPIAAISRVCDSIKYLQEWTEKRKEAAKQQAKIDKGTPNEWGDILDDIRAQVEGKREINADFTR